MAGGSSTKALQSSICIARQKSNQVILPKLRNGWSTSGTSTPTKTVTSFTWLAHRVQRPQEKRQPRTRSRWLIKASERHAPGASQICRRPWNLAEVSPSRFSAVSTAFSNLVILRVNEARDLGELRPVQLLRPYESLIAAPPDTLRVDEKTRAGILHSKLLRRHYHDQPQERRNLPLTDDRRHFVAWSPRQKEDEHFQNGYWKDLWTYYRQRGGLRACRRLPEIARYLSDFDPKAPPPKTAAFWAIVDSNRAARKPNWPMLSISSVTRTPSRCCSFKARASRRSLWEWLADRKNRRTIPHRLEQCGYAPVRNPSANDGLWKISGKRQAIYAKSQLPLREQLEAARGVAGQSSQ